MQFLAPCYNSSMPLKFGTSGLRGYNQDLTDWQCYLFTSAYLQYLKQTGLTKSQVAVAGDFRPSTPRIIRAVKEAITDFGYDFFYGGILPTPAISLFGFTNQIPSIMVTGSHIPYDQNGIKFNLPAGEILKKDEQAITQIQQQLFKSNTQIKKFNQDFSGKYQPQLTDQPITEAKDLYIYRCLEFFPANCLANTKIVFYQHSSAAREIIPHILEQLGAEVILAEFSHDFVPIDTEAVKPEDTAKAAKWQIQYQPNAIMSTDGDGDRPLLFNERGEFVRGDLLGIIAADFLRADSVVTTISCNSALERCGKFKDTRRTKIGSPYVIAAMQQAVDEGFNKVVGYEANGGFLTGTNFTMFNKTLTALPTRDAALPLIASLVMAKQNKTTLSELVKQLPQRFVYSDSLKPFPTEKSQSIIQAIEQAPNNKEKAAKLFNLKIEINKIDFTDGARIYLADDTIVHIRPSGNSPELRTYSEADSLKKAEQLTQSTLDQLVRLAY